MQFKFLFCVFLAAASAVNLVGCGSMVPAPAAGATPASTDAAVEQVTARAQLRWNALLKGDMGVAYQFISPGGRSLMTLEQYRPRVNTSYWRGAKVKEASCAAETCDVTVLVEMTIERVKFTSPIKESWILDAGKWWFVYQG